MAICTMSTTQPIRATKVRTGDSIIVDGTNTPKRWDGVLAAAWNAGVIAPAAAPTVTRNAAATKLVSGAAADGALIQITTSTSHGYTTGTIVSIAGVVGTTEANGLWTITVIDATHFDLQSSSFLNTYVSGGIISLVTLAKAITGAVSDGGLIKLTATGHGYTTGQTAVVSGVVGTTEANGTWTITVIDSNHFDLQGSSFVNAYVSGGIATVTASATPGVYSFAYRYCDVTAATDHFPGGVPSNLSPLATLTANWGDTFTWTSVPASASSRIAFIELWRTTSGQTETYYLVTRHANSTFTFSDNLSDNAIATNNPNLSGVFAPATSMAFLQPDGSPNAMRFVPPPSTSPYIIVQQDRVMYCGQQGQYRNQIFFSEADEPESVPTSNVLTIQDNTGDDDDVTGIARHGMRAFVMKERHLYSVQWIRQPEIDGACFLVADRGAISDRVWTWFEGFAYVMDAAGIYQFDGARGIKPISEPIQDLWRDRVIDFANAKWFWSSADPVRRIICFFVGFVSDSSTRPKRALVYHVDEGVWDVDLYPWEIGGGALYKLAGQSQLFIGAGSAIYLTGYGLTDAGAAIAWKIKTGFLEYPVADTKSKRALILNYNPTVNAPATINLQMFRGYSAAPVNFYVKENLGTGISSDAGSPNIAINIYLNRSPPGMDQGFKQFEYSGSGISDYSQADRFVSFELTGSQSADQITLYDYEIQGASE